MRASFKAQRSMMVIGYYHASFSFLPMLSADIHFSQLLQLLNLEEKTKLNIIKKNKLAIITFFK
jgi:hypothetical protein